MIPDLAKNELSWYVLRTGSLAEKKVNERLVAKNFNTFLPLHTAVKQWSDRKKKVSVPLISSTIFIQCTESDLSSIYGVQGVSGILKFLGKPAVVKNYEIENLQLLLKELNGQPIESVCEAFVPGDHVRVVRGPFKGLYGTSIECEGKHRLLITIDSIGAAYSVSIPRSFVKRINEQQIA